MDTVSILFYMMTAIKAANIPPIGSEFIITEDGEQIITEDGDDIVTEGN